MATFVVKNAQYRKDMLYITVRLVVYVQPISSGTQ